MPQIGYLPRQSSLISGVVAPAAVLRFYRTGSSTPQNAYTDADLQNAVTSLTADSAGLLAKWYLNPSAAANYRYTLETSAGVVYYTEDDVPKVGFTQSDIGATLYPITTEEEDAGLTDEDLDHVYPPLNAARYGAVGDGVADDTEALQALASVVRQFDAAEVVLGIRKTYKVWPSGTGSTIFDFTNTNGVTVNGNGSAISAGSVDSTTPIVFELSGVSQFECHNLNYVQDYQTLDPTNGAILFNIQQGANNLVFRNITQIGGQRGIHCVGTQAVGGAAASNITAVNCSFTSVYYPQQFRMSGNNYFARGIRTINCGRGYFPFNVFNHDVEMYSQHGGEFDDCLLKNYCYTSEYSSLENIKLVYYTDGRNASASTQQVGNALIALEFELVDTTAGRMSNIDIQMHIEATVADPPVRALTMRKFQAGGVADTTGRQHDVTNLRISGHVRNWENASGTCIDLFSTSDYGWTGDFARNIRVEQLRIEDSDGSNVSVVINGQPFGETRGVTLLDVQTDGDIQRLNWDAEFPFTADNVEAQNLSIHSAWKDYTPVWASSGTAVSLGNGTIVGKYRRSGDWVSAVVTLTMGSTTTYGTGTYSFTLPVSSANESLACTGSGILVDVSAGTRLLASSQAPANSAVATLFADNTTALVGQLVPFTWAQDDIIQFQVTYFAAP